MIDCEGTCTSTILPSLSVTCQVCSAPSTCTTVARSGCPKALSATSMVTANMAPSRRRVPGQDWRCIAFLLSVSRIPQCRHQGHREDIMGAEGKESPWHRAWSQPKSPVSRANCLLCIGLAELSMLNAPFLPIIFGRGNTHFFSPDCGENVCFDGFSLTGC